jgi:hypothetical protein
LFKTHGFPRSGFNTLGKFEMKFKKYNHFRLIVFQFIGFFIALLFLVQIRSVLAQTNLDLKPPSALVEQIRRLCMSEAQRSNMGHESFPNDVYFKEGYTIRLLDEIRYFKDFNFGEYVNQPIVINGELARTSQQVEVRRDCRVKQAGERDAYVVFANRQTDILSGPGATKGTDALKPLETMTDAERSALKPSEIAARKSLMNGPIDMRDPKNREIGAAMDRLEVRYLDQVKALCKARADSDYGKGYAWEVTKLLGRKNWNTQHSFTVVVQALDAAGNYAFVCEVWPKFRGIQKDWIEGNFEIGHFYKNNQFVLLEGMK